MPDDLEHRNVTILVALVGSMLGLHGTHRQHHWPDAGVRSRMTDLVQIVSEHQKHMESILRKENQMRNRAPDLPIEDRLLRRCQVFSPGGDNERLMLEAAQEIRLLRNELHQMAILASTYADKAQKAVSGSGVAE